MANALPEATPCCTPCDSIEVQQIAGPAGAAGADGDDGVDGENAYTMSTADFTMPAEGANVAVTVASTAWMVVGQILFVTTAGHMQVISVGGATTVTLQNLENTASAMYTSNAAPTTNIASGKKISPAGLQGPQGAIGSGSATGDLKGNYPSPMISLANAKGALIVGDGTDAKTLAAQTDGNVAVWDAAIATYGFGGKAVIPKTGGTNVADNRVARLDGSTGLPVPLQSSKLEITDDGNVRTTDGDARGTNAVDLQTQRAASTQVASGARSTILGGENNTASGTEAAVVGGDSNLVSSSRGFIGGGQSNSVTTNNEAAVVGGQGNLASGAQAIVGAGDTNVASGEESGVLSGTGNQATGQRSGVLAGSTNVASGTISAIVGGNDNTAAGNRSAIVGGDGAATDKWGQISHGAGKFAAQGDAQSSEFIWRIATADATANVEMFLDGSSLRAAIPTGKAWAFTILLVGRKTDGVAACWEVKGGAKNIAGAATLIAAVTTTVIADGTGATWGVAGGFVVDATSDYLRLRVTGAAASSIRWVAHGRIVEVAHS